MNKAQQAENTVDIPTVPAVPADVLTEWELRGPQSLIASTLLNHIIVELYKRNDEGDFWHTLEVASGVSGLLAELCAGLKTRVTKKAEKELRAALAAGFRHSLWIAAELPAQQWEDGFTITAGLHIAGLPRLIPFLTDVIRSDTDVRLKESCVWCHRQFNQGDPVRLVSFEELPGDEGSDDVFACHACRRAKAAR